VPASERPAQAAPVAAEIAEQRTPAWRRYLGALGPGLVTGAADDDPSGIATYAQAGSAYGFNAIWSLALCLPLMISVQLLADRTALVTGKSLGALALERYGRVGRRVVGGLLVAQLATNVLNAAADLAAVGAGVHLLHLGPAWVWSPIAGGVATVLLVKGSFPFVARAFNALALALISYVAVLVIAHPHWAELAVRTVAPQVHADKAYMMLIVAVLGTTISPYMLFWQSGHRIEEMRSEPVGGSEPTPLRRRWWRSARFHRRVEVLDVVSGMGFSQIVSFSIMAATAITLGAHHAQNIQSASQAAQALKPVAGRFAELLFALGFIGSGMLAIPVLVGSASIGISSLMGKRWGFSRPFREAPLFYWLIIAATLGATVLSVLPVNLIALLVVVAFVNGVLAPAFLLLLMRLAGDRRLMTGHRPHAAARIGGWVATVVMSAAVVLVVAMQFV